jgi:hypothetical protein
MVDLVPGQQVDVRLDLVGGVEVPGHVEHRPAVGEARVVEDAAAGQHPVGLLRRIRLDLRGPPTLNKPAAFTPPPDGSGTRPAVPSRRRALTTANDHQT